MKLRKSMPAFISTNNGNKMKKAEDLTVCVIATTYFAHDLDFRIVDAIA